ncbi:MAG: DUF3047 domain-containing protein [Candidatus Sulfopaludibacter sp.]|nr:DUF3047 domain-containing protein [Candidatus Sulfopaludibacter sp.]
MNGGVRALLYLAFALIFQGRTSALSVIALGVANPGASGVPSGWQIKVNHGKPEVSGCNEADRLCVHLKSHSSSFSLERSVEVDLAETPYLSWSWKVTRLPAGGDFRKAATDDQAAQVLVAFTDRRVLSYIWDSSAPKGTARSASTIPLVHVFAVVCESGAEEANRWVGETRNVAADYERSFGRPAPPVKGLRLQINSQHTGSLAESYFGEVAFRSAPE